MQIPLESVSAGLFALVFTPFNPFGGSHPSLTVCVTFRILQVLHAGQQQRKSCLQIFALH